MVASKVATRKLDSSSDLALAALTNIEFWNRIFSISYLFFSTKTLTYSVTGMNIMASAILGVYFSMIALSPIAT